MWVLYYKNNERINQLSSQIQPEIIKEKIEKKRKKTSAKGNAKGGFNFRILSNFFNSKLDIEGEGSLDTEYDTEQKVEFNTNDVQLNNVLNKLHKLNLTLISEESNIKNCRKTSEIIRFRGYCSPIIEGETMSERLANYEVSQLITWTCKIQNIKITFVTNKDSLVSNTPIHYALSEKNGKLFLDCFGSVIGKNTNTLKIVPIIIGTQLTNL